MERSPERESRFVCGRKEIHTESQSVETGAETGFGGSVITKRNVLFRGSVDLSRRWMNEWMHHGATCMF